MSNTPARSTARMQPARIPPDEVDRLEALHVLQILDSGPAESYDRITRFVAQALGVPIVLVSLVDADRQWFKSRIGVAAAETPRHVSFCGHVVFDRKPLVVADATQDVRFADNPLVVGAPHIRAYIGVPLVTHQGYIIGTLCAIDNRRARNFDEHDLQQLTGYAKILEEAIHAQEIARVAQGLLQSATEREKLFQDTFNEAAAGITHLSPTGRLLRVNQRACQMLGYSEAELHEMAFAEITHPEDVAQDKEAFGRMWDGHMDRYRVEKRLRLKNAGYLWTEVSLALKRGGAGETDYVIAVIVDVSARKQVESELLTVRDSLRAEVEVQTAKLRESNRVLKLQIARALESERLARDAITQLKHFRNALDQHVSVSVTDLNGIITYANQRFSELSGYTQEELIGQTHRIVKSGIHPPEVYEELWRTVLNGSIWHGELCNRRKTGEHYWLDASIVPSKDEAGKITQFVSIRIEITERKRAQELLLAEEIKSRQINERLRQIADSMPAMISYWDGDGICRFANRAHYDRFGLTPQQIVGLSIQDLYGSAFDGKRVHVEAALRGERRLFDHSDSMADGSLRHWHIDYVPHRRDDQVIGFYALVVDVTQQKQIESNLFQAQKLESIGQLAAGIAHEINTPTQFIGNNVGFLRDSLGDVFAFMSLIAKITEARRDGVIDAAELVDALKTVDLGYLVEEVPKAIEQSLEGIERIQNIVGAMKEFSHPAVEKTLLDLNRAINSTIIVASNEWKYVAEVKTDFDTELPQVCVMPGSFNQVILNMIVNAAHAVGEAAESRLSQNRSKGTISISTRRVDHWAEIRIQDTGCGIPEKIRTRIFDPFFTTKPVGKGTGQGLAIAHDVIVKKHGGAIVVESELGIGTTFILRLPLTVSSSDASTDA